MNKLKILTVVYNLHKGGTQRAAQVFTEAYNNLNHDSRVLSVYEGGSRYDEIKDKIKTWLILNDSNLNEIKKWKPDIIHIHSHGLIATDIDRIINEVRRENTKIIETNVFSSPSEWEKELDYSFQLSNWASWLYLMRGGNINKTRTIPYPINTNKFKRADTEDIKEFKKYYKIPENAFVLGRIGQSYTAKWSMMLLSVFNKLAQRNKNIYLVVVNPPLNIIKSIKKSKFKNRIIHIPKIIGDEKLEIAYSAFDIMIHIAEKGESFGYVLTESILCKTPVITLDTPWADNSQAEVVEHLSGGYVVNSEKSLIKAILGHIQNPKDINIDQAKERIVQKYHYEKVAKDILKCATDTNKEGAISLNIIKNNIFKIINNCYGNPSILARLMIRYNLYKFRKLNLYNYPLRYLTDEIRRRISKKIFNRF